MWPSFWETHHLKGIETHKQSIKIEVPGLSMSYAKGSTKEIEMNREIQKVL